MNKTWFTSAILLMVMINSFVLVSTARFGIAQVESWSWSRVASPTNEYFQSIDMINSTDGWAVGSGGAIIRWDGTKWNNVMSPTNYQLVSVDMVSATEGWAIAQRTDGYETNQTIIRWDGASWNNVTSPTTGVLKSVAMISSSDGWAVGSDGCIIHWNGTSWNNVCSPTAARLSFVDMVNSTDGWIVGADGIYHWQENASRVPTEYLVIIAAFVVVLVVWFFLGKRHAYKQPPTE